MTDGQTYELEIATYPLITEVIHTGVSIPDEIQCLLDAGWTWDRDKLVHPKHKNIWRMYKRIDSPKVGSQRFDAEIKQRVREARWRAQRMWASGQ
jgi:hypothetical protein